MRLTIAGSGLAGLVAANHAVDRGAIVTVLESSQQPGGRAQTTQKDGFSLNLGPHALYDRGELRATLVGWGLPHLGKKPPTSGLLERNGDVVALPAGPISFWSSGALNTVSERIRLAYRLAATANPASWQGKSVLEWAQSGEAGDILLALVRVATYANCPDKQDAGAALKQLQRALLGNVWYLDGGWQSMVEALYQRALSKGAQFFFQEGAEAVEQSTVTTVKRTIEGDGLILALPPANAAKLLKTSFDTSPVYAACLDVALRQLPKPENRFILGLDRPDYFSVHSATAKLAPEAGAVIHVARYLGEEAGCKREVLEEWLDRYQPGWKDQLVSARYLPKMQVCGALDEVGKAKVSGRAGEKVRLAGDWIGSTGMLADAAAASAIQAVEELTSAI